MNYKAHIILPVGMLFVAGCMAEIFNTHRTKMLVNNIHCKKEKED